MRIWIRLALIVVGCLLVGLAVSWLLFVQVLHAPASHTVAAVEYFIVSGVISLLIGTVALLIVSRIIPRLGIKIATACLAGSIAAIVNVILTPLLMFSQRSDFDLLVITLLYFAAISLAFAYIVSTYTTSQLRTLHEGARRLAAGDLGARVMVHGTDEIADLGRAFNRMSMELEASFERQRSFERDRRDLIASVSHDLRTPLTSIRAMIEALNDGVVKDPVSASRYLGLIQQESDRLAELIDDLFELSRIESGNLELHKETVPVAELIAETVDALQLQAQERGVMLEAAYEGEAPILLLDGPRMQRVLVNLIENALGHTPEGGRVRVQVGHENGHVELVVADTGEGIALEDQARVFDRFYRSDKSRSRQRGGAGLGLAIARGIVEAHQGSIRVESQLGQGARFIVTF